MGRSKKVIFEPSNKWGEIIPERWSSRCEGTETGKKLGMVKNYISPRPIQKPKIQPTSRVDVHQVSPEPLRLSTCLTCYNKLGSHAPEVKAKLYIL